MTKKDDPNYPRPPHPNTPNLKDETEVKGWKPKSNNKYTAAWGCSVLPSSILLFGAAMMTSVTRQPIPLILLAIGFLIAILGYSRTRKGRLAGSPKSLKNGWFSLFALWISFAVVFGSIFVKDLSRSYRYSSSSSSSSSSSNSSLSSSSRSSGSIRSCLSGGERAYEACVSNNPGGKGRLTCESNWKTKLRSCCNAYPTEATDELQCLSLY